MTRVDARPRCRHGVPVRAYCRACVVEARGPAPPENPLPHRGTTSLVADLAAVSVDISRESLNLPPLGPHTAKVSHAKGRWIVYCSCGGKFRVRSSDRHEVESSWGRHRNT